MKAVTKTTDLAAALYSLSKDAKAFVTRAENVDREVFVARQCDTVDQESIDEIRYQIERAEELLAEVKESYDILRKEFDETPGD